MQSPVLWTFLCMYLVTLAYCDGICAVDDACPEGQFCDSSGHCISCIKCVAYNRAEVKLDCVKKPTDCGACLDGFEESTQGNSLFCNLPAGTASNFPIYIIVLAVLFVFMIAIIVYYVTKTHFFRNESTVRAEAVPYTSQCYLPPVPNDIPRTPPAAYNNNISYAPMCPTSPPLEQIACCKPYPEEPTIIEIKDPRRMRQERIRSVNQEATVYNQPNYGESPSEDPPSYDDALSDDLNHVHEEETRESFWSPTSTSNGGTNLSELLSEARDKVLLREPSPPAAKYVCVVNSDNQVRVRIPVTTVEEPTTELSRRVGEERHIVETQSNSSEQANATDSEPNSQQDSQPAELTC